MPLPKGRLHQPGQISDLLAAYPVTVAVEVKHIWTYNPNTARVVRAVPTSAFAVVIRGVRVKTRSLV